MKIPLIDLPRQYKGIKKETITIIDDAFSQGNFILGEKVEKFENEFARYCGVKYCIGVASGTDALLLSLKALGVGLGDEVITVAFTFVGTALPIVYLGAKPVLVDIDPDTYQIDVEKLKKAITKKTKVIIPVHLFGIPARISEINKIAKEKNIHVLEDACQACGTVYEGKKCGSFGDVSAFSFYPSKILGASGDGGAIVTNKKRLAQQIRAMRNVGQFQKYKHDLVGYNSRLDAIQAGILSIKLRKMGNWILARRKVAQLYNKMLSPLPVVLPPEVEGALQNHVIYTIKTKKRDDLAEFLNKSGVGCAIYYPIPLHLQKALKFLGYKKGNFPVSEQVSCEVLSLPIYPELKESEVKYICLKIQEFFKK